MAGHSQLVIDHFSMLVILVAEKSPGCKEGDGVDAVEDWKEEPEDKQAVGSLVPKLLLRPTIESVECGDAGEEEEHGHLPYVHEQGPREGEVGEHIIAPSKALDIVACGGDIGIRCVKEKDFTGEGDPDYVDSRQTRWRIDCLTSIPFAYSCLTIFNLP